MKLYLHGSNLLYSVSRLLVLVHLKLMAVVRKGESTPWSTDHANWIFANRFFFTRKAAAHGVNLNLRVDAIGHFRMVKKKQ